MIPKAKGRVLCGSLLLQGQEAVRYQDTNTWKGGEKGADFKKKEQNRKDSSFMFLQHSPVQAGTTAKRKESE